MSDLSLSPEPVSRKRKSKASGATQANKKPRGRAKKSQPDPYETAKGYVESILESPNAFDLPEDEESTRQMFVAIAQYAKSLQGSVTVASQTGRDAPPPKTPEQIQTEVSRIKTLICRGIKKLMTWKPSCKSGSSKYVFDGMCADPRVFGTIFGLDGPPTWRAKKFTRHEFEDFVGDIQGRARYAELVITSEVNVRYNPETGEFKVSGSYGHSGCDAAKALYRRPRLLVNYGEGMAEPDDLE